MADYYSIQSRYFSSGEVQETLKLKMLSRGCRSRKEKTGKKKTRNCSRSAFPWKLYCQKYYFNKVKVMAKFYNYKMFLSKIDNLLSN